MARTKTFVPGGTLLPADLNAIQDAFDAALSQAVTDVLANAAANMQTGLRSARPAPSVAGRKYWATDSCAEFLDTGSSWVRLGMPAGSIVAMGSYGTIPGFLRCTGEDYQTDAQYADLFAAIAYTFGDNSGRFCVPDLRGSTIVGPDALADNSNAAGRVTDNAGNKLGQGLGRGKDVVTLTAAQSGVNGNGTVVAAGGHSHTILLGGSGANLLVDDGAGAVTTYEYTYPNNGPGGHLIRRITSGTNAVGDHGHGLTARGADASHNNMPPYLVCPFYIKL